METTNHSGATAQQVQELLKTGEYDKAVEAAKEVLLNDENDIFCLSVLANADFVAGNLAEAQKNLEKALKISPNDLNLNRNLGLVYNRTGQFSKSVSTFINAIKNNLDHPELLLDFLLMGLSMYKISKESGLRAIRYALENSNQLKMAFMNKQEIPLISEASNIANNLLRNHKYSEQQMLLEKVFEGMNDGESARINHFLDIFHGIKPPEYAHPKQRPSYHVFPGLDPITFYDTDKFSWVKDLEDNYESIRDELLSLYNQKKSVKPYIDDAKTGNDDLDKLHGSLDWSSIHLIKGGKYNNELMDLCPVTSEILNKMPMPVLEGNAPEVFLSVLKPGAEIKPHYGLSNIKLTVHLGLDIPDHCAIRVGDDTQTWQDGKVLIFDDSFEHEAWNRSDKERKVLIIEVWNPDLSEQEKSGIEKIMKQQHDDYALAVNDSAKAVLQECISVIN